MARCQRELGAEQIRLAEGDDTLIGSIRRQAAVLHIIAAVEHERAAADIDRSARMKRGTSPPERIWGWSWANGWKEPE
jgi:hypothetical protein